MLLPEGSAASNRLPAVCIRHAAWCCVPASNVLHVWVLLARTWSTCSWLSDCQDAGGSAAPVGWRGRAWTGCPGGMSVVLRLSHLYACLRDLSVVSAVSEHCGVHWFQPVLLLLVMRLQVLGSAGREWWEGVVGGSPGHSCPGLFWKCTSGREVVV